MMHFFRFVFILCVGLFPLHAMACDLEPWKGDTPPTAQQAIEHFVKEDYNEKGHTRFLGVVLVRDVVDEGENVRYNLATMRQYAGDNMLSLSVVSPKKHSCFLRAQKDDEFLLRTDSSDNRVFLYDRYFFDVPEDDLITYLDEKYPEEEIVE